MLTVSGLTSSLNEEENINGEFRVNEQNDRN